MRLSMENQKFNNLVSNLEELVKLYRTLHDVIRHERTYLIQADLDNLIENNKTKETLIAAIRELDQKRETAAVELAAEVNASEPRLLSIAEKIKGPESEALKTTHKILSLLISNVMNDNIENETYALSALKTVNGAMADLKETLVGKSVYGRSGTVGNGPDKSGNLVSKEA